MSTSGSNYEEKKLSLLSQLEETERQIEQDSFSPLESRTVEKVSPSRGITVPSREVSSTKSTSNVNNTITTNTSNSGNNIFDVLKTKLRDQKQQLDQRTSQVGVLEREQAEQKVHMDEKTHEKEVEMNGKVQKQKETYDIVDKRQKKQLQDMQQEKKDLSGSVLKLKEQLKQFSEQALKREESLKKKFEEELVYQKEQWVKVERGKREKWITEQTAKIKEVTVKGLEPELQKIMERREIDISKEKEKCALLLIQQRNEQQQQFSQEKELLQQQVLKTSEMKDMDLETSAKQRILDMQEMYNKKLASLEQRDHDEMEVQKSEIEQYRIKQHAHVVECERLVANTQKECSDMYDIRQKAQLKQYDEKEAEQREVWRQLMLKRMEVNLKEKRVEEEQSIKQMREKELLLLATKQQEERKKAQLGAADKYEKLQQEVMSKKTEYGVVIEKQNQEQEKLHILVKSLNNVKSTTSQQYDEVVQDLQKEQKQLQTQQQEVYHDKEQLKSMFDIKEEEITTQNNELQVYKQQLQEVQYSLVRKDEELKQKVEMALLEHKQHITKEAEKNKQEEVQQQQNHVQDMQNKKDQLLQQYKTQISSLEVKVREMEQGMEFQKYELLAQIDQ